MLYEISKELSAALKAQGCPFSVSFGPERTQTVSIARNRIVIDHGDGDSFAPVTSVHRNPKMRAVRNVAGVARIYGQSTVTGAAVQDHRRIVEHALDMVIAELDIIVQARKTTWTKDAGRFLLPDDLAGSETWPGAVYELKFTIARGVYRRNWVGDARPETDLAAIAVTTVSQVSDPSHAPETACG
jgi:hypothetical protein